MSLNLKIKPCIAMILGGMKKTVPATLPKAIIADTDVLSRAPLDMIRAGFGDIIGKCPLCGENVIRTSFGYGCAGYKEKGCRFSVNNVICSRVISVSNVKKLLETGKTYKIEGFISPKSGKSFSAYLKLEQGRVVFDFSD